MKYYLSGGWWFDEDTYARLIDDYRPDMDSGLFIGFHEGKIDEEICSFDEFDEVEMEETDTELDKAFYWQDEFWKKEKEKKNNEIAS